VVGADGYHSMTRKQLGTKMVSAGPGQYYGVYEVQTAEPMDHEMKLVIDGRGISVMWPLSDNKCRWSFQIPKVGSAADFPQKDREHLVIIEPPSQWGSVPHLKQFLAERAPWFQAQIKDIVWVAHAQFERQCAEHFGRERCWLAGDAAHQASPAGMHSMNQGMKEGVDLADVISGIVRDKGAMELLAKYDENHLGEWRRLFGVEKPAEPECHSAWARENYLTIMGNLPASGSDLKHLLEKL